MNTAFSPPSLRNELLEDMPPEIAGSFSEMQLAAIENALARRKWQKHPVNVRLSMPFFWRRFYLVLVAGPERRSPDRRKRERAKHFVWTPSNIVAMSLFLLLMIPAFIGVVHILRTALSGS